IAWGGIEHGDGFPFAPSVIAHAFYPAPPAWEPLAADMHFNDTTNWGAGNPLRFDVFSVALHELGHTLGLTHSADPASVMYPMYRGIVDGLSAPDVDALRSLYADSAPESLPSGWAATLVGQDAAGAVSEEDGRFVVSAGGRDIWDTADEFRFVSRPLGGDGDVIAHVDMLSGTHRWSKAGVMIRGGTGAGAPHAFALVSVARGLAFQRRRKAGGYSVSTAGGAGTAPQWLWLSRRGD